jgi:hypothetical protein
VLRQNPQEGCCAQSVQVRAQEHASSGYVDAAAQ